MGWAKDFSSNFVLKIAGILYVFQDFYKQKLEKKIRPEHKKEFLEVPSNLANSLPIGGCRGRLHPDKRVFTLKRAYLLEGDPRLADNP